MKSRLGTRLQGWDTNNGAESNGDGWRIRPTMVDADGRNRPGIVICPPLDSKGLVGKVENLVEHAFAPSAPSSHAQTGYGSVVEAAKNYALANNKWGGSNGLVRDQTPNLEEFVGNTQMGGNRSSPTGVPRGRFQREMPRSSGYGTGSFGYGTNSEFGAYGRNDLGLNGAAAPSSFSRDEWSKPRGW